MKNRMDSIETKHGACSAESIEKKIEEAVSRAESRGILS